MKTVKKGCPPRKEKRHVIWLTTSTLKLWNERRKAFGLKNKSNSECAEVLLHGMFLKRTGRFDCPGCRWPFKRLGESVVVVVVVCFPFHFPKVFHYQLGLA